MIKIAQIGGSPQEEAKLIAAIWEIDAWPARRWERKRVRRKKVAMREKKREGVRESCWREKRRNKRIDKKSERDVGEWSGCERVFVLVAQ